LNATEVLPVTRSGKFFEHRPTLAEYTHTLRPGTLGCALAYNPELFTIFGPVPDALIHEDNVIVLRALTKGPLVLMHDALVKRRIHENNIYSRFHEVVATAETVARQEARTVRDAHNRVVMYDAILSDLRTAQANGLIGAEQLRQLEIVCNRCRRVFESQEKYSANAMWRRPGILFSAWLAGADGNMIKWMLPRLAPAPVFNWLKIRANGIRNWLRIRFRPAADRKWTFQGHAAGGDKSEIQS
jgi:hypothetical protein